MCGLLGPWSHTSTWYLRPYEEALRDESNGPAQVFLCRVQGRASLHYPHTHRPSPQKRGQGRATSPLPALRSGGTGAQSETQERADSEEAHPGPPSPKFTPLLPPFSWDSSSEDPMAAPTPSRAPPKARCATNTKN